MDQDKIISLNSSSFPKEFSGGHLVINIDQETLKNTYYRRIIYTSKYIQIVLMSISPGKTIPLEAHKGDQFVKIISGTGIVVIDGQIYKLTEGISININAGVWHYFENLGLTELKLYTIYSPPEHKPETIQQLDDQGNLIDIL